MMLFLILGFIVSLIPSVLLARWLFRLEDNEIYKENCKKAFFQGVFAVLPIIGVSAVFALLTHFIIGKEHHFLYALVYNFIVLAFAEELVKYLAGKKIICSHPDNVSWLDIIAYMGIVGIAFGIAEDIPYAIGASVPVMVIRGVVISHGVYGMLAGYFLGKRIKAGKKSWLPCITIPWLIHGAYDFGLSSESHSISEFMIVLPLAITLAELILMVVFIRFIRRARKDDKYTSPIL